MKITPWTPPLFPWGVGVYLSSYLSSPDHPMHGSPTPRGVVPPYQVAATWYGGTPHGGAHESGAQHKVPLPTRIQRRGIPLRMPVQGRGTQLHR